MKIKWKILNIFWQNPGSWCRDYQHNNTQHNDSLHCDNQHHDTPHCDCTATLCITTNNSLKILSIMTLGKRHNDSGCLCWVSLGSVLLYWSVHMLKKNIFKTSCDKIMTILWQSCDTLMTLLWHSYGNLMAIWWQSYDNLMTLLWHSYDKLLTILW
jgi:hypothetical protein